MKIEIGKEYVTRSGLKVKVYDIAGNQDYPVIAGVLKSNNIFPKRYTEDGITGIDDLDIIGEWQEPLDFDWSCLPAWCNNYIAMDKGGEWYSFNLSPDKYAFYWQATGRSEFIPKEYAPKNFKGEWEKSLFKNPNTPCE